MIEDKLFGKIKKFLLQDILVLKDLGYLYYYFISEQNCMDTPLNQKKILFYKANLRKIFETSTYGNILNSSNLKKKIKKS